MKPSIIRPDPAASFFTAERCRILELLNHAGSPGLSVARASVAPGVATQLHRLHGIVERYLIVEGCGRVGFGGPLEGEVGPGDLVLIPAGTPQQIRNVGETELVFYCICTPRFRQERYERLGD